MYVTSIGFPDRVERDILGMILSVFWPSQATFVVREPLCDVGIPSLELLASNLLRKAHCCCVSSLHPVSVQILEPESP